MENHYIDKIMSIKINTIDEYNRIKNMFEYYYYIDTLGKSISIKNMFSNKFLNYHNRGTFIDFNEFYKFIEPN